MWRLGRIDCVISQLLYIQYKPSYEGVIFENLVGEDFHLNTLTKQKPHIAWNLKIGSYFTEFIPKSNKYDLDMVRFQSFRHNYTQISL